MKNTQKWLVMYDCEVDGVTAYGMKQYFKTEEEAERVREQLRDDPEVFNISVFPPQAEGEPIYAVKDEGGEVMSLVGMKNAGFTIMVQGTGAVIGRRDTEYDPYVAWSYSIREDGSASFFWGHYCQTYPEAFESFVEKETGL